MWKIIHFTDKSNMIYSCRSLGRLSRIEERNGILMGLNTEQKIAAFRGTVGTACHVPSLALISEVPLKK